MSHVHYTICNYIKKVCTSPTALVECFFAFSLSSLHGLFFSCAAYTVELAHLHSIMESVSQIRWPLWLQQIDYCTLHMALSAKSAIQCNITSGGLPVRSMVINAGSRKRIEHRHVHVRRYSTCVTSINFKIK